MSIFKLTEKDPKDTEERIKVINSNMKILFEINPNDPMLIHLACEVLLIKNEDKRAESLLHRALEILKTMKISIEVKRCAQNFSIKEEGTGKSIKHVIDTTSQQDINSLELNKIVSEVNFSLGKIKHRENKAEDAQRYYREWVQWYLKHFAGLYNLAWIQWKLDKYIEAEDTLSKLITILSKNDDIVKVILKDGNSWIDAFTTSAENVKLYEPLKLMAKVKWNLGKINESLKFFELWTRINDLCLESFLELALGYQGIDIEKSIERKFLIFNFYYRLQTIQGSHAESHYQAWREQRWLKSV